MEVCPNNGPGSGPGRWLFYSWGNQFSSVLALLLPLNGSSRQLTASKGISNMKNGRNPFFLFAKVNTELIYEYELLCYSFCQKKKKNNNNKKIIKYSRCHFTYFTILFSPIHAVHVEVSSTVMHNLAF